jgi:L-threonylcarbamoyladenylate synthase
VSDRPEVMHAARELRAGRLAVVPTDTVYGIAALPSRPAALRAVFAAKGRAADKALPVLAARAAALDEVGVLDERARCLGEVFWPGPLTIVVPRRPGLEWDLGTGARSTVAVRVPDCDVTLELLAATGPLAVTSANLSGRPPAETAAEARAQFGDAVAVYVDAGRRAGAASTIVSLADEVRVLRPGAVSEASVVRALRATR